jgi:hypothetical protein
VKKIKGSAMQQFAIESVSFSLHAIERSLQRGITEKMIRAAIEFGRKIFADKSLYYFIGKRDLKKVQEELGVRNPEKYEGVTLVVDPESNQVLTCYRNKRWLKKIRYKH